ncbi:DNA-methyltransferase, partial [Thermodesulfobacteriota bacterium]
RVHRWMLNLTDLIIWNKGRGSWAKRPDISFTPETKHTSFHILPCAEPVYIFRKKGEREVPSEDVVLRSRLTKEQWAAWTLGIWDINPVQPQVEHPAMYPDELCVRLIKMFSYEGDTVLDPWLGSGTTVKVARELNRIAYGYEKEPQYKEVIMKKLGIASEKAVIEAERTEMMKSSIEGIKSEIEKQEADVAPVRGDGVNQEAAVGMADDYFEMNEVEQM